jgi:hypothetical protein
MRVRRLSRMKPTTRLGFGVLVCATALVLSATVFAQSAAAACVATATTLCLDNSVGDHRFAVTASFHTSQGGGSSGNAGAIPAAPLGLTQGGLFWFFESTNPELLVKLLSKCGVNNYFWFFASAGTNVGVTITVTDTSTAAQKVYTNPDINAMQPIQDTAAFPCSSTPLSDLVATIQPVPSTGTIGDMIQLDVSVVNQGTVPAGASTLGVYFSADATISSGDVLFAHCDVPGLGAGGTFRCQGSVPIPNSLSPGVYFVGVVADDQGVVSESNEGNNTAFAGPIALAGGGTDILDQAMNFGGPHPTPAPVTYDDKSSQALTTLAFPGEIFLVVSPTAMNLSAATSLIQTHGGTVIAQIPAAGLYWVQVGVGTETGFINVVQGNPAVIFAGPNVPLTGSQANQPVDLSEATSTTPLIPSGPNDLIAQFDLFSFAPAIDVCGLAHGFGVNGFLEQGGLGAMLYNMNLKGLFEGKGLAEPSDLGVGLARAAEGALSQRQKLIVNMSLQPKNQPNDGRNRQICETNQFDTNCSGDGSQLVGNYASWKSDESAFLVGIASQLHNMPDNLRNNTIVVISAGNSGLDLTNEIMRIRERLPRALPHMLIVGSLGTNGQPFAGHNHSTSPTDMLYAPGVNVVVPGTGGCLSNGTSFAAPAVANLAARLAQQFPELTSEQLVTAIQNAAPLVNGLRTLPTLAQATVAAQALSTAVCNATAATQISGLVTNRTTGQAIGGVTLQIIANTLLLSTLSSTDGSYTFCIPVSLRDQTSSVILQVSHSLFVSEAIPIDLALGSQSVNIALDPLGANVILVETPLHHLGDSVFSTPLNAGLQTLTAEGTSFSKSFTVLSSQLPPNFTGASLVITVNGAECSDPVTLNGAQITFLNNSAVGAQTFSVPFNILLLGNGTNTFTILSSSTSACDGFDDFEFSNVRLELTR